MSMLLTGHCCLGTCLSARQLVYAKIKLSLTRLEDKVDSHQQCLTQLVISRYPSDIAIETEV
eukprot:6192596-Pleurochrysis_carterae.AAC.1